MHKSVFIPALMALMAFPLFCQTAELYGQETEGRRRGRFLQRLREDIFGNRSDDEEDSEKEKEEAERKARQIEAELKRRREGLPASLNTRSPYDYFGSSQRSSGRQNANPKRSQARISSKANRDGFGMIVVENEGELVVARVNSSGNAADAGLKKGDRILEFGGIEASSMDEFEEVAKVMSDGDQMEIKYRRGGSLPKTSMLQWGETPAAPEVEALNSKDEISLSGPENNELDQSYDFVPPSRTASSRSSGKRGTGNSQLPVIKSVGSGSYQLEPRQVQQLIETVASQRQTIERLEREVSDLRRTLKAAGRR